MPTGFRFNYKGPIAGATLPYGELWMWGLNSSGQLGDNSIVSRTSPVQTITGGTDWLSVVASQYASAAIKSDGTLWCWGGNQFGMLGDNTTASKSSPIQTVAGGSNWSSVSMGFGFSGGVKTDGTLWMWGDNSYGQIGDNTIIRRSSPVQTIAGGTNWASISCGGSHTAAIKTDGTLWLWGSQGYSIFSYGALGDNTLDPKSSPIQTIARGTNWSKVSAGYGFTGAIKTDGTLWMWGRGGSGQLGTNSTVSVSSPVQTITLGTNWYQVSCDRGGNTVALKTDSTLWLWGANSFGQLGDNTVVAKSSPIQTGLKTSDWLDAWASGFSAFALKKDGRVFVWGRSNGGLGDNSNTSRSNPTQIVGSVSFKNVSEGFSNNGGHRGAIGNSFTTAQVDLSDVYQEKYYFSGTSGGSLYAWGQGSGGSLGNNNTSIDVSSPVQTIAGGDNWRLVSAPSTFAFDAAIKNDGTLWMWGSNSSGQLGNNSITNRSSPIQTIAGGVNWTQVSCGSNHSAAIKSDGTLWVWGDNSAGQIGDNTVVAKSSPIQTIAGGINWSIVSCGAQNTGAIKTDGTLWAWGTGSFGKLGDGTAVSKSSPIQVIPGATTWRTVAYGNNNAAATKTDGTLWLWGNGLAGQLGDNTAVSKSSPVQTITAATNWSYAVPLNTSVIALKTDGTIWTWGGNTNGQLGDNTTVAKSSPVQIIGGGTNWTYISGSQLSTNQHCAAIKTNGSLWLWGSNSSGQLGDGTTTSRSSPIQTLTPTNTWRKVSCGQVHTIAISYA